MHRPFNPLSRRDVLNSASCGFGSLALAALHGGRAAAGTAADPLAPRPPHFPAKAKRVIFLFMEGGPSQIETFDYKPGLDKYDGKTLDPDAPGGQPGKKGRPRKVVKPNWGFARHGNSGRWVSEIFPNVAAHADKLCVLNGMYTDPPDHPQAVLFMHTGSFQFVRPSVGAWLLYGLGTEGQELPGFVALKPVRRAESQGAAFLPAAFQPTPITADSPPYLANGRFGGGVQRAQLDLAKALDGGLGNSPEVEGVIQSSERAFRMQARMPGLLDFARESKETLALYGIGEKETDEFGRRCLLARRLSEAGVRFVELAHYPQAPGGGWDQHKEIRKGHADNAKMVDKPIAGLLADLARRGLLDETLVLWGGEFGRTPWAEGTGRDHNPSGFSMWLAGGGVKAGSAYGGTDETGAVAVEGRVHVHDLHATMLHLMGLDHEKLTYRYSGRDFRLTDVAGRVVPQIIA